MAVVKIKNINASHKNKQFVVKGRVKPCPSVQNNTNGNGRHLNAILFDKTSSIQLVAFDNDCDDILMQLKTDKIISIENVIVKEVQKNYKITDHKYNLILKSSTKIKCIDFERCIQDYPKFPVFSKDLTTLKAETSVDVIGECTEIGDFDEVKQLRPGKIKIDSSEIRVNFYGEKATNQYEVGKTLIIYTAKLKFYQGNYFLNVTNKSHVEYPFDLSEINLPAQQSSPVTKYQQTGEKNNEQHVSPCKKLQDMASEFLTDQMPSTSTAQPNKNVASEFLTDQMPSTSTAQPNKRKHEDNGIKVMTKISKCDTALQTTPDEIFILRLLFFLNQLPEADKIQMQNKIIEIVKKDKCDRM